VQEEAIPDGLAGNDIVAQAKAGMGKTAVFVTVTLERINPDDGLQALCLVHTRELAYQVAKEFERFKAYLDGITVQCIYGGVPLPQQKKSLESDKPHVVVAAPAVSRFWSRTRPLTSPSSRSSSSTRSTRCSRRLT